MQRTVVILLAALALAAHAAEEPKPAKEDNFFDRAAKVISQDAKTVAHAAKQAGKDIGHAVSKAAKQIASNLKSGDGKTGKEGKQTPK